MALFHTSRLVAGGCINCMSTIMSMLVGSYYISVVQVRLPPLDVPSVFSTSASSSQDDTVHHATRWLDTEHT
jgi:hypothetical protein